jgi:hypothetical protein
VLRYQPAPIPHCAPPSAGGKTSIDARQRRTRQK